MGKTRKPTHKTSKLSDVIAEECANYIRGGCIWGWPCPAEGSPCRYFEESVLPAYPELLPKYEAEVLRHERSKA